MTVYIPWLLLCYYDCIYHDYCCYYDCIYTMITAVIMTVYIPWLLLCYYDCIYHDYCCVIMTVYTMITAVLLTVYTMITAVLLWLYIYHDYCCYYDCIYTMCTVITVSIWLAQAWTQVICKIKIPITNNNFFQHICYHTARLPMCGKWCLSQATYVWKVTPILEYP